MPKYIDGANVQIFVLHESTSTPIGKLQSIDYDTDVSMRARGAGLGEPAHDDVATGERTGSISATRKLMRLVGYPTADLFSRLISGAAMEIREPIASTSTTHTTSETLVGIVSVQLATSGVRLVEGEDYGVNYATDTLSFYVTGGLPEAAEITYVTSDLRGWNLAENYVFDIAIADFWSAIATGTIARTTTAANVYVGTGALAITPSVTDDGASYDRTFTCYPGREYVIRFAIKGTSGDTIAVEWEDGTAAVACTPVGTAGTLASSDWEIWKYTFTPDEASNVSIQITNTTTAPNAFYIDHFTVSESDPKISPLAARSRPYRCVVQVRDLDGAQLFKLLGVHFGKRSATIGDVNSDAEESLEGFFLDYEGEV